MAADKIYTILKLYKVITNENKPWEKEPELIRNLIQFFIRATGKKQFSFNLNYGTDLYKDTEKVLLMISKVDHLAYLHCVSSDDFEGSNFIYQRPIQFKPGMDKPKATFSKVNIFVEGKVEQESIIQFLKDITLLFHFEYGYVDELNGKRYDLLTEQKKRFLSPLFGKKFDLERFWQFHLVGIQDGFLRNLYPLNLINRSHIEHPVLEKVIRKSGSLDPIGNKNFIWTLSNDALISARQELSNSKLLIVNSHFPNKFSKSAEKDTFFEMMKLSNM